MDKFQYLQFQERSYTARPFFLGDSHDWAGTTSEKTAKSQVLITIKTTQFSINSSFNISREMC